jgi:hypothetical protein
VLAFGFFFFFFPLFFFYFPVRLLEALRSRRSKQVLSYWAALRPTRHRKGGEVLTPLHQKPKTPDLLLLRILLSSNITEKSTHQFLLCLSIFAEMAFHQSARQPVQRLVRPTNDEQTTPQPSVLEAQSRDESQTWVLFYPATETGTSASYISGSEESLPTPGRSRLSDLGSLDTIARSAQDAVGSPQTGLLSLGIEEESIEDDAELDSLDSHLAEFRALPTVYNQPTPSATQAMTVLPAHDGLGSFHLDNSGMGRDVQEQIYAFERFNPRRIRRRRESLELGHLELTGAESEEAQKILRIEAWRMEQSRALLEEVQKETRRRRRSHASSGSQTVATEKGTEKAVTMSATDDSQLNMDLDWHDDAESEGPESRGFWAALTRKVIQDLIGIDDKLLSVFFGEALPEDDDMSITPRGSPSDGSPLEAMTESTWQAQVIERVARELGLLVNHISHHPGAFSTYMRMQQSTLPYAGLPVIHESMLDGTAAQRADSSMSAVIPEFKPTINAQPPTENNVRFETPADIAMSAAQDVPSISQVRNNTTFTKEEWEQDLDIKLVFRYLRSRFTSRSSNSNTFATGTSHLAASSTQDNAAKAARVRQHHPLVARTRPVERRTFKATTPSSPVALRHASSCASQSTRRSARRSSCSSRHYWDIGGSLGTGSVIAPAGPMGSWGEV